jgi:hypothetical protein
MKQSEKNVTAISIQSYPENPLDKNVAVPSGATEIIYNVEDKEYVSYIQNRLERARNQRQTPFVEFGGLTYDTYFLENEKIANTWLPPKKNEDDVIVASGTVEAKLDALLANVANLNLSPEVLPFDAQNNYLTELGEAITDTIEMTEEHDGGDEGGDEEKKLLRQRELLKQGTVFVQEEWLKLHERKKKLTEEYGGQFKDWTAWTEKLECVFEGPGRTILYGPNVYLGNVFEYYMDKQPYVFAVINQDYSVAKAKYGKFENWKYVVPGKAPVMDTSNIPKTIYSNNWRLTNVKGDQVEIVIYQDQTRDEFQIIINGVMMLPIGFPLSAVCPGGKYNITKQVFKPIHHKFAYGKAFVSFGSVQQLSALIDEMLKLFVLKTRKSFTVPYVNTTGRVISSRVLTPGRISMGIPADALKPIGQEGNGVTSSEFEVYKELQDRVDKSTVSNQFMGQGNPKGTTATEVMELQRQAKLTLGLTVASCALLEKKLAYLRIWNLLANWFNKIDTKVIVGEDGKEKIVSVYRNTNKIKSADSGNMGRNMVIPTDEELPDTEVIWFQEQMQSEYEKAPVKIIYLSPTKLKQAMITWRVVIVPKEKEGGAAQKVMFREMLADVLSLLNLGSQPNKEAIEEEFSRVWGQSKNKFFSQSNPAPEMSPDMGGVSTALQTIGSRAKASTKGAATQGGVLA